MDLLVSDSLSKLAPLRSENDAVQMHEALAPVEALTAAGIGTLLAHHPKKGLLRPGQAARGSGALPASVDIVIEMGAVGRRPGDRRRRLRSYSRHAATPRKWVIEWTADGTDYRGLGPSAEPDFEYGWPVLEGLLREARRSLTREELWRGWPESAARPAKVTLWKWLDRLGREGKVERYGAGGPAEAYSYALPGMLRQWHEEATAAWRASASAQPGQKPPGVA